MKKSRLITTFLALPLLVSALVSCTADVPDAAPGSTAPRGSTGPTASGSTSPVKVVLGLSESTPRFIHSNHGLQDAANQALLQGTLVTGPGHCLGVKTAEGRVELPAFPGTTVLTEVAGQGPLIEIEGHTYLLGEEVKFAGGTSPITEADRTIIATCSTAAGDGQVFFIQQISD